jgi:2-iminobutanoate/2-iminopropanoate deaminase
MARETFAGANPTTKPHPAAPIAARVGSLFFTGAVWGVDARTGALPDGPQSQADLAFDNLAALLAGAGMTTDNVGHVKVWYGSHEYKQYLHGPWARHFPDPTDRPARHSMVKDIPGDAVIQLEVIAVTDADRKSIAEIPGVSHGNSSEPSASIPFGARLGKYAFSAATFGRNGLTGATPPTIEGRVDQAYENNRVFLDLVGLSEHEIGQIYAWHTSHELRDTLERAWDRHFPDPGSQPARNLVVRDLPGAGASAQLEIIAVAGAGRHTVDLEIASDTAGWGGRLRPGACWIGDTFFSSSVPGIDPASGRRSDRAQKQVAQSFDNVRALLDLAGFALDDVGHVNVWMSGHGLADAVDEVWNHLFPSEDDRPVRHDIVADLYGDAVIEVEVIAARNSMTEGSANA